MKDVLAVIGVAAIMLLLYFALGNVIDYNVHPRVDKLCTFITIVTIVVSSLFIISDGDKNRLA